jgi:hypothetical protein
MGDWKGDIDIWLADARAGRGPTVLQRTSNFRPDRTGVGINQREYNRNSDPTPRYKARIVLIYCHNDKEPPQFYVLTSHPTD